MNIFRLFSVNINEFFVSIYNILKINGVVLFFVKVVFMVNVRCFNCNMGFVYCFNCIWKDSDIFYFFCSMFNIFGIFWEFYKFIFVMN